MKQKLFSILIAVVLGLSLTPAIPASAADGDGTATISPSGDVVAGSTGNWTIRYTVPTDNMTFGGGIEVTIPAGWTTPQTASAAALGYVTVSCNTAGFGDVSASVTGSTIGVTLATDNLTADDTIDVVYGEEGLGAIAQTTAATGVEFTVTSSTDGDDTFTAIASSPRLNVIHAAVARLGVTSITDPIIRGTASDVTVTAYDGYGNVATGYTGTIDFTSTDTAATLLPSSYTFVPANDNGTHTFIDGVTFNTVGEQSVTATDSVIGTITGAQSAISVYVGVKLLKGGGGGAPRPGVTPVRGVMSSQGKFYEDVTCESEDECVEIFIPEDTIGKGPRGAPLYTIKIFEAEDPPPAPGNTCCIGLVYDIGPSGATFDPPINLTIKYDEAMIPEGVNEENLVINFWDEGAGEWDGLVCTVDVENNTTTACVSHFTSFALVASTRPAAFETSYLTVLPREVEPGEEVTIKVKVANTGDLSESYEVNLRINEVVEATQEVTLEGGSSQKVTFTTARDTAGVFTVDVDGQSGSFIVKEEAPVVEEIKPSPPPAVAPVPAVIPAPPPEPEYNWGLIIGWLIAGIVVIGLITCFIVIGRLKAKGGG